MSFRIFAAGTGKFNFMQDDCIDDSDIDMVDLISKFFGMEASWQGLGEVGVDIVKPEKGIIDLMQSMATQEFLHNLSNSISFLAMCSGSSQGWVSVSARETHTLWPDSVGIGTYRFDPGEMPGTEFVKKISPALKTADMANWGVLRMLGIVIAKYSNHIGSSATPMLNIQLSH